MTALPIPSNLTAPLPASLVQPRRRRPLAVSLALHLPADYPMIDLAQLLGQMSRHLRGHWDYRHGTYHVYSAEAVAAEADRENRP